MRARDDMIERSANAHMTAPADNTEPTDSSENAEPIEPDAGELVIRKA